MPFGLRQTDTTNSQEDVMNSINLTGRLTQDPEQRTAGELQITNLRLAIPRRKGRDGEDRGAVYVDVVCFGPLAKVCGQYLAKGRRAAVQGRLELDEWEAKDGSSRRRHKVIADEVEFLDPAQRADGPSDGPTDEVAAQRERHQDPGPEREQAA